ncbi:MAG: glycosyltransferase [Actinomycetota bacterium]
MGNKTWSLKGAMRRLWADHVVWTRNYVVAAVGDAADTQTAAGRLLKNQEDIGGAIVPYYGEAAGTALTGLLKQHILIAVDLIEAAKSGESEQFEVHDKRWTHNAEEIAELLSSANPNWPKKDVVDILAIHLKLTKDEAVARMQQDWDADVEAFDQIFTEILTLADVLSDGIIKQFPDRFAE